MRIVAIFCFVFIYFFGTRFFVWLICLCPKKFFLFYFIFYIFSFGSSCLVRLEALEDPEKILLYKLFERQKQN